MLAHTEWIDPQGLNVARLLIAELETSVTHQIDRARISFLNKYLDAVDGSYGPIVRGPLGVPARALRCVYTQTRGGRMYCRTKTGPQWKSGEPSYVCAQGMPAALRPYLMQKWAHDIDIENCHVSLMYQIGAFYHLWPEHCGKNVLPLDLVSLRALYENRAEFIEHISTVHGLPSDEEMYPGYRKEMCKPLLMRILYGGRYDAWINEHDMSPYVRSKRVEKLVRELTALRDALLNSVRFRTLVNAEEHAQYQRNRSKEAARRGMFSKIAQHLECMVLLSMRKYLIERQWTIHSLIFDGMTVEHRDDAVLDLRDMAEFVELDTQFKVVIVEKKLFQFTPHRRSMLLKCRGYPRPFLSSRQKQLC